MRFLTVALISLALCVSAFADNDCAFETIHLGGAPDGFVLPADATHRSPDLVNHLQTRNPKDYDDQTIDRHFGDSFKAGDCIICDALCAARIEIVLKGSGGLDCNDSIFIGRAGGTAVWSGPINPAGCNDSSGPIGTIPIPELVRYEGTVSDTLVRTIDLDVKALQDLVCGEGYPWLDVIVQDDHAVDSLRLVLVH